MQPVVYAAVPKSDLAEHIPPEVLAQCAEIRCSACDAEVIVIRRHFHEVQQMTKQLRKPLVVLCNACAVKRAQEWEEFQMAYLHDTDVQRRMTRHYAEMN
jgi:hypothetical protein